MIDASIVITTFNRRDALGLTLQALATQTVPARDYEVLVVDDGSTDGTFERFDRCPMPYQLRVWRQAENCGIAAGRNVALREAKGEYIICLSDDMLVPENFVELHLETLRRFPDHWVVGGFTQLPSLRDTPFGRYLDDLERNLTNNRIIEDIEDDLSRMRVPTARNLSFPTSQLQTLGYFDEQFRNSCEDKDLAQRATEVGIQFLYNARIECVHNDQVADLERCCRQQYWFAHDGARFCAKYPEIHGNSVLARANGPLGASDTLAVALRKIAKFILSTGPVRVVLRTVVAGQERAGVPDRVLFRQYRLLIGLSIFRGWRAGLESLSRQPA